MATRSEKAAAVAGAIVALASLGFVLYRAIGPLLIGYDAWEIAAGAAIIVGSVAFVIVLVTWNKRRKLAGRIRRR